MNTFGQIHPIMAPEQGAGRTGASKTAKSPPKRRSSAKAKSASKSSPAQGTMESVRDDIAEGADAAKAAIDRGMDQAGAAMKSASQSAAETYEWAEEAIAEAYRRGYESASDAYDHTAQFARETARDARRAANQSARKANDYTQENPLMVAALGLGLGIVLGALIPMSRRERDVMAPARDEVERQARQYGSYAARRARDAAERNAA